jgi:hypothetical protein
MKKPIPQLTTTHTMLQRFVKWVSLQTWLPLRFRDMLDDAPEDGDGDVDGVSVRTAIDLVRKRLPKTKSLTRGEIWRRIQPHLE